MTYSFDPALADDISKVRDLIQDVDSDNADFQDETLQAYLDMTGDVLKAATEAVKRLWIKYTKLADVVDVEKEVRVEYKDKAEHFKVLYDEYKQQSGSLRNSKRAMFYVGGVEKSKFTSTREDETLVPPRFTRNGIFYDPQCEQGTIDDEQDDRYGYEI